MKNMEKTAALFDILCGKYDGANSLGKKAAQKMFYFFERSGIDLNLRYGIHYYGPYSAKLDDEMYELESEGYIVINTSGPTHSISRGKKAVKKNALSNQEKETVQYILQKLEHKSPLELEALSTMDYIANSILPCEASDDARVHTFEQIKGTKFKQNAIRKALEELKQLNFIAE